LAFTFLKDNQPETWQKEKDKKEAVRKNYDKLLPEKVIEVAEARSPNSFLLMDSKI
jgi:hypothetical protein|tara:strand:- start:414 stop:581 length:168 start_codon:yes stop_codon:yes gene_type:complete